MEEKKGREVVARVALTDEQRKIISKYAERDVKNALIVRLGPEEAKRLAPGLISAVVIEVCW